MPKINFCKVSYPAISHQDAYVHAYTQTREMKEEQERKSGMTARAIPRAFAIPFFLSLFLFLSVDGDREARKFVQQLRLGHGTFITARMVRIPASASGGTLASRSFASFEICRALIQCRAGRRHLGIPAFSTTRWNCRLPIGIAAYATCIVAAQERELAWRGCFSIASRISFARLKRDRFSNQLAISAASHRT